MSKADGQHMVKQKFGKIISVSTSASNMIRAGNPIYGPGKAALEAMTRVWANELKGTGVDANIILPGGAADTSFIREEVVAGAVGERSQNGRLLPGDVILSVDGSQALRNPADLYDRLRGKPGTVKLAIERAGKVIGVDTPVRAMAPLLKSKSLDLSGMVISEPWRLDQRFSGNRGYLVVDFIMPDTPAENVEVAMSSVIVSVDGQAFSNLQDLHSYLSNKEKGSEVELVIKAQSDDSRFHNSFRVVRLSSDDLKWIDADT